MKLVTETKELITREKITRIHQCLPDNFVRIHRSILINKEKVSSLTRKQVTINKTSLPIGRIYKTAAMEQL